MRIVGRRKPMATGLEATNGMLKLVIALRGDKPYMPHGVYRFHTHEEADAWTLKMLTRPNRAPQR